MTSEYKSLLMQYYDNYALFNDPEQADILLRYLHGVDNLVFNLGCNSTILNYWTKTPLQLAGVIPLTRRTNNNYMTSQSPSMSMNQSQQSILRRGSLLERNHTSVTSQVISSSLPSGRADEADPSQLVEVHPDFGEIPVARKETAVLHRRHLGKKRKSRSLRAMSEDYGSWGSISSFSSD
uniref:RUN domain-containing protein n=1 Tax=Ciona savignyi TaxID=51511 RepID=H2YFY8_CIOSA